jgi:hypothetical protein
LRENAIGKPSEDLRGIIDLLSKAENVFHFLKGKLKIRDLWT